MAAEITKVLKPVAKPLELDLSHKPHVILVVGVNGTGKTTTVGKLENLLKTSGKQPLVCAGEKLDQRPPKAFVEIDLFLFFFSGFDYPLSFHAVKIRPFFNRQNFLFYRLALRLGLRWRQHGGCQLQKRNYRENGHRRQTAFLRHAFEGDFYIPALQLDPAVEIQRKPAGDKQRTHHGHGDVGKQNQQRTTGAALAPETPAPQLGSHFFGNQNSQQGNTCQHDEGFHMDADDGQPTGGATVDPV